VCHIRGHPLNFGEKQMKLSPSCRSLRRRCVLKPIESQLRAGGSAINTLDARLREIVVMVERAEGLSPNEAPLEFLRAARMADTFVTEGVPSSDHLFAAGYCWYSAGGDEGERQSKAENYLSRAVALDPSNAMAHLYLGHLFFDQKRYKEAAEAFQLVDVSSFVAKGQNWRALKARELLLCCLLFTDPDSIDETALHRFYRDFRIEYTDARAAPWEILSCFDSLLRADCPATVRRYAMRISKLAEHDGLAEKLKEQFPNLAQFVS
jgi:tetratricopeptide (TPR) repeat protein